ncbi:putative sulfate exporter family transporter [Rhodomicrobium vannielii ATCC 17100]|nr:putative sulfate exporter family transporter [Rhodomicrobium vannielii ATCC 17100]
MFGKAWNDGRAAFGLYAPGLMLSIVIAMAATSISIGYGGPTILFALLLGMAFNFVMKDARYAPGLQFAAREILRVGVALLGARITATQITGLGWSTLGGVTAAVVLTIIFGLLAAPIAGMTRRFGVLTAGAVAICGASAAAAIAAVLRRDENHERDMAFTIIAVTTLSTVCMVLYPLITKLLHFDHADSGVFLGGTIHDVAQVVGAGYSVSPETGDVATIVKLLRVALLLPVVVVITLVERQSNGTASGGRTKLIPNFLLVFIAIVTLNSFGLLPSSVQSEMSDASRWCIVISIAALGIKTSLAALAEVGHRAIMLMVLETIFIACLVMALVRLS